MRIVCAVGVESTGKTTLCQALAERFDALWLAEGVREYLSCAPCQRSDITAIAREQQRRECELLEATDGGVVLDTDLAAVIVWWREKCGPVPAWLEYAFASQRPRLYLLCRPDLPRQSDPLYGSPADLLRLHEQYRELLTERRLPFVEIEGWGEVRTQVAIAAAKHCLTAGKGLSARTSIEFAL